MHDRMMSDVEHYFDMGIHRTGTDVDRRTSDWLEQRMRSAGLSTRRQRWSIRQYFSEHCGVVLDQDELEAFPIWYSPSIPEGITAPLTAVGSPDCDGCAPGAIGYISGPRTRAWWQAFRRALADDQRLKAAIAVSGREQTGGLIEAENVAPEDVGRDLAVPILQVRSSDIARYEQALAQEEPVTLHLAAEARDDTAADNVMGIKEGGDDWIVISTPSSGWFRCAGERGPGIAILLALAESIGARDSRYSYLFTANSGHELGFWGARVIHEEGFLPPPDRTRTWLHLGASIATPEWREHDGVYRPDPEMSRCLLQTTDHVLQGVLESAFSRIEALSPQVMNPAVGELANVAEHGYSGFGLVSGGNVFFHTREDAPATVSESSMVEVVKALEKTFAALEDVN